MYKNRDSFFKVVTKWQYWRNRLLFVWNIVKLSVRLKKKTKMKKEEHEKNMRKIKFQTNIFTYHIFTYISSADFVIIVIVFHTTNFSLQPRLAWKLEHSYNVYVSLSFYYYLYVYTGLFCYCCDFCYFLSVMHHCTPVYLHIIQMQRNNSFNNCCRGENFA